MYDRFYLPSTQHPLAFSPEKFPCKKCILGKFAQNADDKDDNSEGPCQACAKGKFQAGHGASMCHDCGLGEQAPNEGMRKCLGCGKGTYQDEEGKSSCKHCVAGKFLNATNSTSSHDCELCPSDTYQDDTGQDHCKSCAKLSVTLGKTGSDSPLDCVCDARGEKETCKPEKEMETLSNIIS